MNGEGDTKVCLTIAGLDPSGGAGIIADIKTFSAFGCYAAAVVTSVTYQDTVGVYGANHQSGETVREQIEPVFDDLEVAAVKTGMLPSAEVIRAAADILRSRSVRALVVDPVVRSTSGFDLIDDEALSVLVAELFPLAQLVTPNIPETERITGIKIASESSISKAASSMMAMGAKSVLIKGGHLDEKRAVDHLFINGDMIALDAERISTTATHGTGCTLSAAIAANLAIGRDLLEAVQIAKRFVTEAIRTSPNIGRGHSPINHLVRL
jgi:hydroxymethylpyrimidine kinase/phosphomethylpyrimidine kinase